MPTKPSVRDVHINSAMTNISIAYRNPSYIGDQLFPTVPVQHQTDKYFTFDKDDWFRNDAGPRAPGTRGVEGGYGVSTESYSCVPIAYTKPVTDEEEDNADDPLQPRRIAVEFATDKLLLYHEKAVADLVFDAGSWSSSATPATTWDDPASDPIKNIEEAKESLVSTVGREPNVMVMGRQVWTDLKRHPDLINLYNRNERGMITLAQFKELFEIPKILIGTAIYTSTDEDAQDPSSGVVATASVTYSFVWPKNAALLWVPPSAALAVPAAGYTFSWKGRTVESFRREEEKTTAYRAEYNIDVKVTSADAGYEFIDCVA